MALSLNDDKLPLQEGRAETLPKEAAAPVRDQIVQKLWRKLVDDDVAMKVDQLWQRGNANRATWLERQSLYLQTWDEHLVADTEGSFEGSSQLHIPMPMSVAKTMHARYMQAVWQDPPFNVKARNEASTDRVATVADTMRFYVMDEANYRKGLEATVDQWIWDWVTQGSSVVKWRWACEYESFIDVKKVKEPGLPKIARNPQTGAEEVIPTIREVEKEVTVQKKWYEGPVCDLVDLEDLLIVGGGGDPDQAEAVIHRQWLTASDLWTLADRKVFNREEVEKIIDSGRNYKQGAIGNDQKSLRAENAGNSDVDGAEELAKYEILEAYLKLDVTGSGINSDVIVWVHPKTKAMPRATYLRRVSPSGERPFAKIDFLLRKGQEYGTGIVEMLYPLSRELDALHNIRIDSMLIATMPIGFYAPASGLEPETIEFRPGSLIPVNNPQSDIVFPNLGNRVSMGLQEEAGIQTMVERLTSISDLNLGLMNGQGATRTATGARALVGEMSSNLDVHLRRLNRGWKKALRYLLHTLQKRIPIGIPFRVTGDDGKDYWRTIRDASEIEGDYDIEVSPNSASSNPQIQQELANEIWQMANNPLAIQMGSIGPGQYFEAQKNYLVARGVKDWSRFVSKPNGYERLYSPEEEANRILRGQEVPVTPNMDHEGFIAFVDMFHETDELMGQFPFEAIALLEIQKRKHAQMLEALQAQAAQQANASQMRTNASMSQQQTTMAPSAGPAATAVA